MVMYEIYYCKHISIGLAHPNRVPLTLQDQKLLLDSLLGKRDMFHLD
jgi:hypothetical protein